MQNNQLSGELPASLCELRKLQFLNLSGNEFTGKAPEHISRLTNLRILLLHRNQLDCPMPDGLSQMTRLEDMQIINSAASEHLYVKRRFLRRDFERVFAWGPSNNMNNTFAP